MPNLNRECTGLNGVVRMRILQAGLAVVSSAVLLCVPASADAQLTKQEQKCIGALTKDGGKLSKSEGKLQQKCLKDVANAKFSGTADACLDDIDYKRKVDKAQAKTLSDDEKHCFDGTGFVTATAAQTNISGKAQALELAHDLLGSPLNAAVQTEKANITCQQKVQKALDKVLAAKIKSYTKCATLAAKGETTMNLAPFENCLVGIVSDAKVGKIIAKLEATVDKSCTVLEPALGSIFSGDCSLNDLAQFKTCTDAIAECRACTTIAGMNGLATDCDLLDNGLDDGSCADAAPTCGDGNVDPGEECDPGAEPTCCSSTCTNNSNGISCDDGVFCNGAETCQSGVCVSPGDPCAGGPECNNECREGLDNCFARGSTPCTDDGNVCTHDHCDGAGACGHTSLSGSPCNDGDACTTNDTCNVGTCAGGPPLDCDDGNQCTTDSCDSVLGCQNVDNTDPCDDGTFCNGLDTCDGAGGCTIHSGDPCPGTDVGPACNDSCDEGADDCSGPDAGATSCDDGLFCTVVDSCNGGGSCVGTGSPCPGQDVGPTCNDSCNEGADDCSAPDAATTSCDDGLFCTATDTCNGAGTCVGAGSPCAGQDVGPDCFDSCDEAFGRCFAPDAAGTSCDDGLFCTLVDTCDGLGSCVGTGDPCIGGPQCNNTCREGFDNCWSYAGSPCDLPDDACDVTPDECNGIGTCVDYDPTAGPELCYVAGDEDCDGFADSADPHADSLCQAQGIQPCTCADACKVGRVVPQIGASTSLEGLTPLLGEGSVYTADTSLDSYDTVNFGGLTYTFNSSPNLNLFWSWTGNAGHTPENGNGNIMQLRFAASDSNALSGSDLINEGPHTVTSELLTYTARFARADTLPASGVCDTGGGSAVGLRVHNFQGGGGWQTWGANFPISALQPSIQSDVTTNLLNTAVMPIVSSPFQMMYQLQHCSGGCGPIRPQYDACQSAGGTWGYGINLTSAIYGTWRFANICD